jgi:uncharacterized protein YfaT (DUF1175 family)
MLTLGKRDSVAPLAVGTIWEIQHPLAGWSRSQGDGLATELAVGRRLRLIEPNASVQGQSPGQRWRVRLLEDGYPCWLDTEALLSHARPCQAPELPRLDRDSIKARVPRILDFALHALAQNNTYRWGGTLGPHYDCSGLVQSAYAHAGIWLPRDAYLQERFCRSVAVCPDVVDLLEPGDLIFFGSPQRCTHVALHLGMGRYLHSSGQEHGRNGLGLDDLFSTNDDPVASHYRAELRGAGRVMHSHDGSPLPP